MTKRTFVIIILSATIIISGGIAIYFGMLRHHQDVAPVQIAPSPQELSSDLQRRGETIYKKKYFAPLIATYQKMLSQMPDNPDIKRRLAFAYFGAEEYDKAGPLLEDVLKAKMADAESYYELGVIAQLEGNTKDAKKFLKQALKIKPSHTEAKKLLDKLQ